MGRLIAAGDPVNFPMSLISPVLMAASALLLVAGSSAGAIAQESYMLKHGSNVGPETKIKPVNCITGVDGSVTCDTRIENSPSDTPARPSYQPFNN